MTLVRPTIISPDTSHWANWIDAALGSDATARQIARDLHSRLLELGRIPFLSWHHLEEMLVVDEPTNASARVSYLQSLPMIAWMRTPGERGLGGIINILAAEAVAFDAGCESLDQVREHVRAQLLTTGSGLDAIGQDGWVWDAVRQMMRDRRPHVGMVSALSGMKTMDDRQTVGELSKQEIRPPAERREMTAAIHKGAFLRAKAADPRRSREQAYAMADEFVRRMMLEMPTQDLPVRQLIVETYGRQGIDEDEVRDERTIAELSELGTFRSHLRVVAEKTGLSFDRLKRFRMESLPSWRIGEALKRHGQERRTRPGSDLHDQHLAVLAAYTDVLYVDKRTHEDFRRVRSKEPSLASLFGVINKARVFSDIAN